MEKRLLRAYNATFKKTRKIKSIRPQGRKSMPSFNVSVPHSQDPAEVATRLKSFSEKVRGDVGVPVTDLIEEWDEQGNLIFGFKAMGFKVSGKMENRDSEVRVSGTIPFAALPFRGIIEKQVAAKIREAIAVA